MYFVKANTERVYPILICLASIWGFIRMVISNYMLIRYAGQFLSMNLSMNTVLGILLKACVFILIMYQTYVLGQKRKYALDAGEK